MLGLAALVGLTWLGIHAQWFRAPYPAFGKWIAWRLGAAEAAYNFGPVVAGRLYRSGRPDAPFLAHLRDERGLERVVSLTGRSPVHVAAEALGLAGASYGWGTNRLPPRAELLAVLDLVTQDVPTLVHCGGGSDRSGYLVALLRVLHQGWPLERALREMSRYGHDRRRNPQLHRELRRFVEEQRDDSRSGS